MDWQRLRAPFPVLNFSTVNSRSKLKCSSRSFTFDENFGPLKHLSGWTPGSSTEGSNTEAGDGDESLRLLTVQGTTALVHQQDQQLRSRNTGTSYDQTSRTIGGDGDIADHVGNTDPSTRETDIASSSCLGPPTPERRTKSTDAPGSEEQRPDITDEAKDSAPPELGPEASNLHVEEPSAVAACEQVTGAPRKIERQTRQYDDLFDTAVTDGTTHTGAGSRRLSPQLRAVTHQLRSHAKDTQPQTSVQEGNTETSSDNGGKDRKAEVPRRTGKGVKEAEGRGVSSEIPVDGQDAVDCGGRASSLSEAPATSFGVGGKPQGDGGGSPGSAGLGEQPTGEPRAEPAPGKKPRGGKREAARQERKRARLARQALGEPGAIAAASSQPKRHKALPAGRGRTKLRERTLPPVCTFFMRGKCKQGSACTFRHEGIPRTKFEVCAFWRKGQCLKGEECVYAHDLAVEPCRFLHLHGRCKHGDACPYSHEPLEEDDLAAFKDMLAAREDRVRSLLDTPPAGGQGSARLPPHATTPTPPISTPGQGTHGPCVDLSAARGASWVAYNPSDGLESAPAAAYGSEIDGAASSPAAEAWVPYSPVEDSAGSHSSETWRVPYSSDEPGSGTGLSSDCCEGRGMLTPGGADLARFSAEFMRDLTPGASLAVAAPQAAYQLRGGACSSPSHTAHKEDARMEDAPSPTPSFDIWHDTAHVSQGEESSQVSSYCPPQKPASSTIDLQRSALGFDAGQGCMDIDHANG